MTSTEIITVLGVLCVYSMKVVTDVRRSGYLRRGILAGCILSAVSTIAFALSLGTNEPTEWMTKNLSLAFALGWGFAIGNLVIALTNVFDHKFLANYGIVRKVLFWSRNVSLLSSSALMLIITVAVGVTMGITSHVSAQEQAFEAKKAELEGKMALADSSATAKPAIHAHHHKHHHHKAN